MSASRDLSPTITGATPIVALPARKPLALYRSDWKPAGVKADWDKCSMDTPSTKRLLGTWGDAVQGQMVEAVAWFDYNGGLRVLIADYDCDRRIILRQSSRGTKLAFERVPTALTPQASGEGE